MTERIVSITVVDTGTVDGSWQVELNDEELTQLLGIVAGAQLRHVNETFDGLRDAFRFTWPRVTRPTTPREPRTVDEALEVLAQVLGAPDRPMTRGVRRAWVRRAKRATHPDTGGTADAFRLVTAAEIVLREHALI